jgi:hypothetical protein
VFGTAKEEKNRAMTDKRRKNGMLIPTAIFAALAVVLLYVGYRNGHGQHIAGVKISMTMIAGLRGIFIGSSAGGLTPGGPFVNLPLAAGLYRSGAGVGTMVAFITGWSIYAIARLPMEIGILGWRLTAIRIASTFMFPPLAGFIAHILFRN